MPKKRPLSDMFDEQEIAAFGEELQHEASHGSERATILVAATAVDEMIRRRLFGAMVDEEAGAALLADTATAPLGAFSARIQAAVAFGVLTPTEGRCADKFREIRNVYAHRFGHDIDRSSIRDKILALSDVIDTFPTRVSVDRDLKVHAMFADAARIFLIWLTMKRIEELRAMQF